MPMPARKDMQPQTQEGEVRIVTRAQGGPIHESPLTPEDYAFITSLPEQHTGDRVRSDMALLITDDDTQASLGRYADFFAFAGVNVEPAVVALPRLVQLLRVQQHLSRVQDLVQRHITATGEPLVNIVSDVHRMVNATPDGSALRDAFATLESRWKETFRGGGRPANTEDAPAPTPDPSQPK